jgi:hypothetical protein
MKKVDLISRVEIIPVHSLTESMEWLVCVCLQNGGSSNSDAVLKPDTISRWSGF